MVCGKGMKTLKRHISTAHGLKPGQYRKQFNIPAGTPLVATDGGALPEVTGTDGETVFRCRKGDADDLANTIRDALANPEALELYRDLAALRD